MLAVGESSQCVGRSTSTTRRWIRFGLLPAAKSGGRWRIDPDALDELREEIYHPMFELPAEWRKPADGTSAPNWVATVALSRIGR
jgi:excisionase family DNA binding protein